MKANRCVRHNQVSVCWLMGVDEGGLTKGSSPGAGANSHYHNYSFYVSKDIAAGDEILVNYGEKWFLERGIKHQSDTSFRKPTERLVQTPGRSGLKDAGRGLFATRAFESEHIILPIPTLTISDPSSLDIERTLLNGTAEETLPPQLLLNNCFRPSNSSILLYPYGSGVSYIIHGGMNANAKVVIATHQDRKTVDEKARFFCTLLQHKRHSRVKRLP